MLIAEAENTTRKSSVISTVYMFCHSYFEGVEFYDARRYVNVTKDRTEEYLFYKKEEE